MDSVIKLVPDFKHKIWGGRRMATEFGYEIPDGPVGECWAISAHPNGDDIIETGEFRGRSLSWLWASHRELFGGCDGDVFPLLVKIIDAREDLSIQVHPDDAYAAVHEDGSLGKKECWYVLSAEVGGTIVVGQNARSKDEFAQMVAAGRWDELLNEIPVHAGDFFQIDPGCVHAIKGGTMILEIQQSSDVTYRVYDYDRPGDDGAPRPLHLEQSLDVIDYDMEPPATGAVHAPEVDGVTVLVSNDRYTVERVRVSGKLVFVTPYDFTCVSVIEGEGALNGGAVARGDHLLALAACGELSLSGDMTLIVSHL